MWKATGSNWTVKGWVMAAGKRTKGKCSRARPAGADPPGLRSTVTRMRRTQAAWGRRQARPPRSRQPCPPQELTGEGMMSRFTRAALCAAVLVAPAVVMAADLLPVENFARHPPLSMPRLSPDGKYLAVRWDDGSSHALVVYKVDDMSQPTSMLRMPKYELPVGITWVSPTRLVVEKG